MSNDDRMDELLIEAAQDYNRPPETPRDEMWARIEATRWRKSVEQRKQRSTRRWLSWSAGIAATLVLGIALGRVSVQLPQGSTLAVAPAPAAQSTAYQVAAVQHLSRTEALLTSFRADAQAGRADAAVGLWAGELLSTTRLLLDSPAAEDPRLRSLLEDLELVLVQISILPAARTDDDLDMITEGLEQRNVLPRLRTAIPAGPATSGT